jgi:hypothetical protein
MNHTEESSLAAGCYSYPANKNIIAIDFFLFVLLSRFLVDKLGCTKVHRQENIA